VEVEAPVKAYHDEEPEGEFWGRYKLAYHAQQPSSVTCVDFSPVAPHDLAATASARVAVLDGRTLEQRHALARFRAQAFSGRYRGDGRLLVAGGEDGVVRVFDAASRVELRAFSGHRGPVRAARFARNKVRCLSGGDDGTLREWELATSACTTHIAAAHSDHIRGIEPSPAAEGVWATASYDGAARVWDVRAATPQVASLPHGAPVEAVAWLSGGTALATAGGNRVRIWDVLSGRVLAEIATHQKTVTALALDPGGARLLTGGADHLVKVLDVHTFRVLHTFTHHAPVLALAIAPDGRRLALGAADGDLCVLTRVDSDGDVADTAAEERAPGTVRYFLRGRVDQPQHQAAAVLPARPSNNINAPGRPVSTTSMTTTTAMTAAAMAAAGSGGGSVSGGSGTPSATTATTTSNATNKRRLERYDVLLRKFKYAAALDAALATNKPAVVVGVLRELMHRGGLRIALKRRDETTLEPLLVFLVNCITVPQYAPLLVTVCTLVVDMYASVLGRSMRIDELFYKLQTRLHRELELQGQLLRLMGALDLLVAASEPAATTTATAPATASIDSQPPLPVPSSNES